MLSRVDYPDAPGFELTRRLPLSLQAFTVGLTVCAILLDQLYGWNVHIWDLGIAEASKGRQVSLTAQTLFLLSSGLPKVSVLVTYSRIAPKSLWLFRMSRFLIVWVMMLICIFFVVIWTQCVYVTSVLARRLLASCLASRLSCARSWLMRIQPDEGLLAGWRS